jgi:hypothetical protein
MRTKSTKQHIYYLRFKARRAGSVLVGKNRYFVAHIDTYGVPQNRWQSELIDKFGYTIQFNFV